ncbi:hypothetical protein ACFQ9Q_38375 [Streptomyces virginiae]|uniref:hypothetical protein n=1 Tax=Streptomyces virginiae TaxID=1961 RepID=UPI0036BBD6BB
MSSISEALPLVGVVVGAATSYLVSSANERTRWRRQQSVRWDERRLNAYAEYGHAVKALAHRYLRIAVFRGIATGSAPLEPTDELLDELGEAESHRSALSEGLWLLGDAATNAATVRVNHSLWHLEWLARGLIPADAGAWDAAFAEYRTARQEYLELARASLDLPSGETRSDVAWPPPWRTPPDPARRHPGA